MNRRQKIIVSVTSIFLVLLILLGLTYAYFLTQITGNTNPKSISVTTANLQLLYGDGNGVLEVGDKLTPGNPVNFKTQSGEKVTEKTFTVTNNGDATIESYGVTFEDLKVTYANPFTDENGNSVAAGTLTYFEFPNDFKITIKCTSNLGKACNGYEGTMPSTNDILLKNSIEKDEIHSYTFALRYDETGIDQSIDMNKTFQAKLDIINTVGTVDIEGTVTGHKTGDYVQVNSTPKKSYLNKDGKFKVVGLDIENHTVAIYNGTTPKSSTTLNVEKGESSSISNNTATVTDTDRKITININSTTGTYEVNKVGKDAVEGTPAYYAQTGELKVGDYFIYSYNPGVYTTTLVDDEGVSQTFNSAQEQSAEIISGWRVLSIDNDTVQIIPVIKYLPKLTMYGANGWINGEKVLNEMCETLYSGDYGTARSINISDIDKKVKHSGLHSYYLNNTLYSTNSKTLEELETETKITIKDEYRTRPDGTSANGMKLDYYTYWLFTRNGTTSSEYNNKMIANPLTSSWTGRDQTIEFKLLAFYTFGVSEATTKFTDLLGTGETYTEADVSPYWLANRVADIALNSTNNDNSYIKYGIRIMSSANASRRHMWNPKEGAQDKDAKPTYSVVPVVSLNNDLQIKKESGGWMINE